MAKNLNFRDDERLFLTGKYLALGYSEKRAERKINWLEKAMVV